MDGEYSEDDLMLNDNTVTSSALAEPVVTIRIQSRRSLQLENQYN